MRTLDFNGHTAEWSLRTLVKNKRTGKRKWRTAPLAKADIKLIHPPIFDTTFEEAIFQLADTEEPIALRVKEEYYSVTHGIIDLHGCSLRLSHNYKPEVPTDASTLICQCSDCGYEFLTTVGEIRNGKQCPSCHLF